MLLVVLLYENSESGLMIGFMFSVNKLKSLIMDSIQIDGRICGLSYASSVIFVSIFIMMLHFIHYRITYCHGRD